MHLFIYNIFLFLYSIGIHITSLWNPKARLWLKGRRNIWTELEKIRAAEHGSHQAAGRGLQAAGGTQHPEGPHSPLPTAHSPLVWMHCSSLGEFEQGRPVLEAIRQQYPTAKILLTFFSPSGYEVRKNSSGADYVAYLPLDSKTSARKFISLIFTVSAKAVEGAASIQPGQEVGQQKERDRGNISAG